MIAFRILVVSSLLLMSCWIVGSFWNRLLSLIRIVFLGCSCLISGVVALVILQFSSSSGFGLVVSVLP